MWWRSPTCPVRAEEQEWIEHRLHWMRAEFGAAALHGEVIAPTPEYFPNPYAGTRDDVLAVLRRVCRQMSVDESTVDLALIEVDDEGLPRRGSVTSGCDDAATRYALGAATSVVAIPGDLARRPVALVAGLAHQVGHVRLLREGRIATERRDLEPLADLLTVYFGLGIFAANAVLDFRKRAAMDPLARAKDVRVGFFGGGFQVHRHGYLTEPMFGYALAYYAWLRDEPQPPWLGHLDTNPRVYCKRGLKYLRSRGVAG